MRFEGKVAIVTGAAGGIGRASAERFARDGASVVLVDLNEAKGEAAAAALCDQGFDAAFMRCDVSSAADVERVLGETENNFGPPHILVNNAAIYRSYDFLAMTEDQFTEVIRTNLNSVFLFTQAVARRMVAAKIAGAIVNIASINARMSSAGATAYSASKGGVCGFTAAASLALIGYGIRINAVAPGTIDTEIIGSNSRAPGVIEQTLSRIPAGRLGAPEEIASVAAFLASDDASYMTGQTIFVDGGRTALSITMPPKK